MDPTAFTLTRLSPVQADRAIGYTHLEWGKHMELDKYVKFFKVRQSPDRPWGINDGCVAWGLVRRGTEHDPEAEVFSYCVTYRRASQCTAHGRAINYGVSAVVCPEKNRKKGYTQHLIKLLHYVIAPRETMPSFPSAWGAPPAEYLGDAHSSILYSGVGKDFYRKCTRGEKLDGWVYTGMGTRVWEVPADIEAPEPEGQWLDYSGAVALESEMERCMVRDLAAMPKGDRPKIAMLPVQGGLVDFQLFAMPVRRPGSTHGIVLPAPEGGESPFAFWTFTGPTAGTYNRLTLLHISPGRDAAGKEVPFPFSAVLAAAKKEKVESIEGWGPNGWDDELGGAKIEDHDNLPSIVSYTGDEEWVWCDKYVWC